MVRSCRVRYWGGKFETLEIKSVARFVAVSVPVVVDIVSFFPPFSLSDLPKVAANFF